MIDRARPPKRSRTPAEVARMAGSHTGRTALVLAVVAVVALAFAPFGVREEMFDLDYAIAVVVETWAANLALLGAVLAVLALVLALALPPRRGWVGPLLALVLAGGVLALVERLRTEVATHPPIHDVATDWSEPLMFGPGVIAERGRAAKPVRLDPRVGIQMLAPELEGQRVAEINPRTCDAARPVILPGTFQAAYTRVREAVEREGLIISTENPDVGRIEAVAEMRWLRLQGDVLARIQDDPAGARVDFRSISRRGEIDLGENCRRIARLQAALAESGVQQGG